MIVKKSRLLPWISSIALISACCSACDSNDDEPSEIKSCAETPEADACTKHDENNTEAVCHPLRSETDFTKADEASVIDYLMDVCRLSSYFKNNTAYTKSKKSIGDPCFCYGADCSAAGYERPEIGLTKVMNESNKNKVNGWMFGCENVEVRDYAVPICIRSSNVESIEPKLYFPNGMCLLAMSKCKEIKDDPSSYICSFATFAATYNKETDVNEYKNGKSFEENLKTFKADGCPEGSTLVEFLMDIVVGISDKDPSRSQLDVYACAPKCETDADCRTGEYDYILQEEGKIGCVETDNKGEGSGSFTRKVCFDKRTVESSSIGIRAIPAKGDAEYIPE